MADVTLNINATIDDGTIANSKLVDVADCTIKGRECGTGPGDVQDLTPDQVSTILDTAADPFVRTSNLPAPGTLPDGDYGDIVVSGAGTVMSIDSNIKDVGGNGALDSGKLLIFNTEGQIQGSADNSALAAVKGTATGTAYGVHGETVNGTGVFGVSTNGNGIDGGSINGHAATLTNFSPTNEPLHIKNANAANTANLATFRRNDNLGVSIKNDGGLEWTTATGAGTTRTNLGLGTAALNNTGDFDPAGSATSAQAFAIQRSNHTGTQDASTITGTKTSSFISDFASTVRSTILTGISFASSAAVLASDTVLAALGKLQAFNNLFTTVGLAISRLANPSAIRFLRINADNTVSTRSASEMRTDLGLGTASIVNTGTGAGNVPTITDADARYALKSQNVEFLQIFRANTTITNIPAGLQWQVSDSEAAIRAVIADLSGRTQIRLIACVATAGNASSKFLIRYKAGAFSANKADYSVLGDSSTEVYVSLASGGDIFVDSGWINITAGAIGEVWIGPFTIDGDGAADLVLKQAIVAYK